MKVFVLLATFVLAASAASFEEILLKEWQLYKAQYNKSYSTPVEDYYRMRIFKEHKYTIATHNLKFQAGEESYEMGINAFTDMHPEEVDAIYNGFNRENRLKAKKGEDPELPEIGGEKFVVPDNFTAPKDVNWLAYGAVTPVRNQGLCGSCYAFAAIGAMEGHFYIKNKKLVNLSPQQIVDCSTGHGNNGCYGGLASISFKYVTANGGINDEMSYPYEAKQGPCRYKPSRIAGKLTGLVEIPKGDEVALKDAVAVGPVSVSIDSSLGSFMMYKSGVFSDPKCSPTKLGHAVLVVGYGYDEPSKKEYWLVKNSWGTTWGDKGYIKMAKDEDNLCGIATRAVYPKV